MQPAVLLGFLGATMLAAVSSMPVDNRNHNEEMVTRCIIEVLSSALSKSNAPPITPECRQILRKSGKEVKDEEKSENENTRFEVRLLRDPADTSEAHRASSREDAGAPGEDTQGPPVADTEGGGHSREGAGEPQGSLYPSDSHVATEAKSHHSEKGKGETYQKREHGEDGSQERHLEEPGETQIAFLNQPNPAGAETSEKLVSRYGSARGPEKTHSRERSSQESGEETRGPEKWPREPASRPEGQEESEESEEDASPEVDKRSRPRHHHGRSRPDRSSQEGNPPREESRHPLQDPEESDVGTASFGAKRAWHPTHRRASEEEPELGEEGRSYPAVQAPGDLEGARAGGRGSGEPRAPRPPSDENREEEDKGNRPRTELSNGARGSSDGSEGERGHHGGRSPTARGGEPGAYATPDRTEDKRFLGEARSRAQESQMDQARRHAQGELRNYLNYGEEGAQGKWPPQGDLQGTEENREDARLPGRQYAPRHITEKRLGELLSPYYDPSQWKSSHFQRRDNRDENFLEGEEENGLTLNEKNFFPEYNYDWWEKKPFEEDVNWGYEKRNLAPKLDVKRQYDRVAELDRLLHYRKKSAEFPDFYDSEEQMSPRHPAENEKERAGQGALTEEEEKELENLAAMDLELQKIAEKFSGNRRG
ncbi:Secretogranin-1 [Camelus dromedarius]|uniref:Secretogranin-1 n=1 Tax=Camelus dromedarius TaxID=9838 RepID=A0A5N4CV86_CAMDR|nr:secretogranin-1 [Camelus dromedarius]KAB1262748.1 Secretogranin-1 [Camelus dromedarius]